MSFFEKNPKSTLIAINLLFVLMIAAIFYSFSADLWYKIRCGEKRHIVLRENQQNSNQFRIPPYDKTQKYPFNIDENGFVKPAKIHENSDVNIFFLGGSTTECEYVDELYRFPYLAGRILEEKTGKKINSYNGGKSGNNSIHSVNNLLNKVAPLKPHIVVWMEKIKAEQKKILILFVAIAKSLGAKPVLMTQFNKIEDNPSFILKENDRKFDDAYRKIYSDFQNITREIAKENNVMLIDLAREVPVKYLYDWVHLGNDGSKFVA